MPGYKFLGSLKEQNVNFQYTPFTQLATVDRVENWAGACNILSHDWMLAKVSQHNLFNPTTYRIDKPNLPHPVVLRDNSKTGKDISEVNAKMKEVSQFADKTEISIEYPNSMVTMELNQESKINALLNFIDSKPFHYGVINTLFFTDTGEAFGHAVSFVKKRDSISWFDPTHGEISFTEFSDFRNWFHKEVKEGVEQFLIPDGQSKAELELFPLENFTNKQIKEHPLAKKMNRLNQLSAAKNITVEVGSYRLLSYSSDTFLNPQNKQIIEVMRNIIESRQNGRAMRDKYDPTMKQANQYLNLLAASEKDQVMFDTVMYVFSTNYYNQNLTETIAITTGLKDTNEMCGEYSAKLVEHFGAGNLARVNNDLIKPMEQALKHGRSPDLEQLKEVAHELSSKQTPEFRPSMK